MIISENKNKIGSVIEVEDGISWFARHFGYLVILVFFLAISIGYFIFLRDKIDQYYNLQLTNPDDSSSQLQSMNSYLAELQSTINQFNQFSDDDLRKLEIFLPEDTAISDLIIELSTLASQNKLTLTKVDISQDKDQSVGGTASGSLISSSDLVLPIDVRLGLKGNNDYASIKNFISNLEKNMRILDVTDMIIAPQEAGFDIDLRTYYLPRS